MPVPDPAVLEQRIGALEARIKTLEGIDREDRTRESDRYAEILARLAQLETRVGYVAAKTGAFTGFVSSIATALVLIALKSALGG